MPNRIDPRYREDLRHLLPLIATEDHAALVALAIRISQPESTPEDRALREAAAADYAELRDVALEAATLTGDPNDNTLDTPLGQH